MNEVRAPGLLATGPQPNFGGLLYLPLVAHLFGVWGLARRRNVENLLRSPIASIPVIAKRNMYNFRVTP